MFGQQTSSKKFQRKFKKLKTEKIDKFLISNNFEKTKDIPVSTIWGFEVEVTRYHKENLNETFTLVICKEFPESYEFVGIYLTDSLESLTGFDKNNLILISSTFNYEYTSYKDNEEYNSFLVVREN